MFAKVDVLLLHQMQKFCDRLQALTGISKFQVEKWALISNIACLWFSDIFSMNVEHFMRSETFILTLVWLAEIITIEVEESAFVKCGAIFFKLHRCMPVRIASASAAAFISIVEFPGWTSGSFLSLIVWIYASACVPKLPGKNKARHLYERALIWLNDRLQPVPESIPVRAH